MNSVVRRIAFALFGVLGVLAIPAIMPAAHATSFDCAKAATPTERAICGDPALSQFDDRVAAAFKSAMGLSPAADWQELMRNDQREWLRTRNTECKGDRACLKREYEVRLTFLHRPGLKYMGRYVAGRCGAGGLYLDVTPRYPEEGNDVMLYLCPDISGNVLMQTSGTVDDAGRLSFDDATCPRVLQFLGNVVTLTSPASDNCALMTDIRTFRRDPRKSPFYGE